MYWKMGKLSVVPIMLHTHTHTHKPTYTHTDAQHPTFSLYRLFPWIFNHISCQGIIKKFPKTMVHLNLCSICDHKLFAQIWSIYADWAYSDCITRAKCHDTGVSLAQWLCCTGTLKNDKQSGASSFWLRKPAANAIGHSQTDFNAKTSRCGVLYLYQPSLRKFVDLQVWQEKCHQISLEYWPYRFLWCSTTLEVKKDPKNCSHGCHRHSKIKLRFGIRLTTDVLELIGDMLQNLFVRPPDERRADVHFQIDKSYWTSSFGSPDYA